MQQQHPYKFLPSSHQECSGEWRVETCKIRGAAGQWRVESISQSDFLICLAASDFGVLADLDWEKEEKGKSEKGNGDIDRGKGKAERAVRKLFFISAEIVKSDRFSRFLRVDPILYEFDRFYRFSSFKPDFTRFMPYDS
jgi:hypothetical protein